MEIRERKQIPARVFCWVLCAVVVGVIFYFSSQKAEDSSNSSGYFTEGIYRAVHGETEGLDPDRYDMLDALIRFCAHATEYMILGLAVFMLVSSYGIYRKLRLIISIGGAFCVAVLDETLQTFVPGRYGDISDILTDTIGAAMVVFLLYLMEKKKPFIYKGGPKRRFMGITLDDVSFKEALERIMDLASDKEGKHYIVTANADHVVRLQKDVEFQQVYAAADMVVADGMPLLWIEESLAAPMKERVTGADLFPAVCREAATKGFSIFFLGGMEDTAQKAAEAMQEKYPGLKVAGYLSPGRGFEENSEEMERIFSRVGETEPDILMVCFGAPRSEKFIYHHRDELVFRVALPFGAGIDFAAGKVKRAPEWMQKLGMEWLYRFLQEPGRLFKRYFIEDIQIFYLALKYRISIVEGADLRKEEP